MFSADLIDKYKSNIANLATIIILVVISINVYKTQSRNIAALNERQEVEAKKNKVLENISQLQKKIDGLTAFVNNKDLYETINNLNVMAREFSVKITSIKPAGQVDAALYTKFPFELIIEADNYHQIGKFIGKIESSPNIYRVESLDLHPPQDTQGGKPQKMVANLKIDTILFKVK